MDEIEDNTCSDNTDVNLDKAESSQTVTNSMDCHKESNKKNQQTYNSMSRNIDDSNTSVPNFTGNTSNKSEKFNLPKINCEERIVSCYFCENFNVPLIDKF